MLLAKLDVVTQQFYFFTGDSLDEDLNFILSLYSIMIILIYVYTQKPNSDLSINIGIYVSACTYRETQIYVCIYKHMIALAHMTT